MFRKPKPRTMSAAFLFMFCLFVVCCLPLKSHMARAKGVILYKCVSTQQINTAEEYEGLLNKMAGDGWEFDHIILKANIATFKRLR